MTIADGSSMALTIVQGYRVWPLSALPCSVYSN